MTALYISFFVVLFMGACFAEKYKVVSIVTQPNLMVKDTNGVGNDRFEGFIKDLMDKVAESLNIDYELSLVKDGKFGSMDANGEWNGMIGELVRGEADIAAAPLTITSARESVVDFSKPFMTTGITMLAKKPQRQAPGGVRLLVPFSSEVWIVIAVLFIGSWLYLMLLSLLHGRQPCAAPTGKCQRAMVDNIRPMCPCFKASEKKSMAYGIFLAAWLIFLALTGFLYLYGLSHTYSSANIDRMVLPVQSVEDLVDQSEIKYGFIQSGSTMSFFKSSKVSVYERIWNAVSNSEPSTMVSSYEEGVQRVRKSNGRYILFAESSTVDYISQQPPCDLMRIGSRLNIVGFGLATPLNSSLRDSLSMAILQLSEDGTLQYLENKWWMTKGQCGKAAPLEKVPHAAGSRYAPPSLDTFLRGPFIILALGFCLSLAVAFLEFIISRFCCKAASAPAEKDATSNEEGASEKIV